MSLTKPPLGLMPENIWKRQRYHEVQAAIGRYQDVGKTIPGEWIVELWRFKQEGKGYVD
jgi:hypothetical protein